MFSFLKKIFGSAQSRLLKQYESLVKEVNLVEKEYQTLSEAALRAKTEEFKSRFQKGESLDSLLPEAYACVKNACRRLLGQKIEVSGYEQVWDMIPYDVQILGAIAMHKGAISEMHTGEGKTLTAVMPLYLNALSGKSVHLVTVNDYLAERDCQWVGSVLRWLGLSTGALTNKVDPHHRKELYQCDVVYGTSSEFGFDYLRDNSMASDKDEQVQKDYYFAIVDEIDSILIDEARTPLIISGPVANSQHMYGELKTPVALLVKKQRDLCNSIASKAKKMLANTHGLKERSNESNKRTKEEDKLIKEALRLLWLVSKGTPNNRILKRVQEDPDLRSEIDQWDLYYYSDQNKQEKADALAELFITVNEKASEFELTDKGIATWCECTSDRDSSEDFVMLDLGYEYQKIDENKDLDTESKMQAKIAIKDQDANRKERAHNLRQLLRAHLLMEKDIAYIIQENKIIIIDENTGRPQPGRRFSDGLHQAIEAKEDVSIQKETQTYATVTLQNYFRMYEKLAGMTGTAITEANEFKELYKIDVLQIPTHKPVIRKDFNDEIYMTEREKYKAILDEVNNIHEQGRPILIGTESVDVSEKLSRVFRHHKLPHTVLNAKNHLKEAEIIAQAGQEKAITIATNMAGRGTDIKLGKGVAQSGGLHVIGTTRHQSRRIDEQLLGRSARQGDPGSSKFFASFEDDLLRHFASPRITNMLKKFRPDEGEAISASILNKSIRTAQTRIEQRNYTFRKHTLEYDDVMNHQRQAIYTFRNDILHTNDIESLACDLMREVCEDQAHNFFVSRSEEFSWNPEGYSEWLTTTFPVSFSLEEFNDEYIEIPEIVEVASKKIIDQFKHHCLQEKVKVEEIENELPTMKSSPIDYAIRSLLIRKTDQMWQEHLHVMDHLRSEVHLRSFGQKDPLVEFKHEAFSLFETLSSKLREEIASNLFKFRLIVPDKTYLNQLLQQLSLETKRSLLEEDETQAQAANPTPVSQQQAQVEEAPHEIIDERFKNTKRNDTCPCGSGLKFKKCHGAQVFNDQEPH